MLLDFHLRASLSAGEGVLASLTFDPTVDGSAISLANVVVSS